MRQQAVLPVNAKGNVFWIFHNRTITIIMYITAHILLIRALFYYIVLQCGKKDYGMNFVYTSITVLRMDYILWKRKVISKQWKRFQQHTGHFRRFPKMVLRKCFLCSLLHLTLNTAILITLLIKTGLAEKDADPCDEWKSTLCLGCNVTNLSSYTYNLMAFADTVINTFGLRWPLTGVPIFLCCFFTLLRHLVTEINTDVEKFCQVKTNTLNYVFVMNLRKRYQYIQGMVADFDSLLHGFTLNFYVGSFFSMCHGVTFLIRTFDELSAIFRFNILLLLPLPVLFTGCLSYCAATITEEFTKGFQQIQVLTLYCSRIEKSAYDELHLLNVQLSSRPNGMTLGGLFVITKVSFLSFLGAIASYVIILLQMFPELLEKLKGK